jgi:hypothetical protein
LTLGRKKNKRKRKRKNSLSSDEEILDSLKQLNHLIATSESTYRGLIIEESKLSEDLCNKYGTVDIDIETGNISEKSIV